MFGHEQLDGVRFTIQGYVDKRSRSTFVYASGDATSRRAGHAVLCYLIRRISHGEEGLPGFAYALHSWSRKETERLARNSASTSLVYDAVDNN